MEACHKVIELLKKYERFDTTVLGGESNVVAERLRAMDQRVCLFCSQLDGFKIVFCYFIGMLPYLSIDRDAFFVPYMTEHFIKMKYEERKLAKSIS